MNAQTGFIACSLLLTGCFPGAVPPINTGNTSTQEAPDTQHDSENQAPVFHINVYANPTVDAVGGDQTINGDASAADRRAQPVSPPSQAAARALVSPPIKKAILAPRNKADEPVLIGKFFGGATVDEYNQMACDRVTLDERVEPVDPVWEGCRVYWNQD